MKTILSLLPFHKAITFAAIHHNGQYRKDNKTPYTVHTLGVAALVEKLDGTDDEINAAHLHDIVEDTPVTLEDVTREFGQAVSEIVNGLSNVYTKDAYPEFNRSQRKALELERLSKETASVIFVKGCDVLYNICDIGSLEAHKSNRMMAEKYDLADALFGMKVENPYLDFKAQTIRTLLVEEFERLGF